MPDDRLNMRLDARTIARLVALAKRWELKRPDVIRQAVRQAAEREGIDQRDADD